MLQPRGALVRYPRKYQYVIQSYGPLLPCRAPRTACLLPPTHALVAPTRSKLSAPRLTRFRYSLPCLLVFGLASPSLSCVAAYTCGVEKQRRVLRRVVRDNRVRRDCQAILITDKGAVVSLSRRESGRAGHDAQMRGETQTGIKNREQDTREAVTPRAALVVCFSPSSLAASHYNILIRSFLRTYPES